LIAAPLSLSAHTSFVAQALGIARRVRGRMQRRLERQLGFRWDTTDTDRALAALAEDRGLDTLLVHDRGDREVPFASSERIAAAAPRTRLVATEGLGHARILRSASVIAEAIAFLRAAPQHQSLSRDAA
ncbi:MAG: alpha/beta hydrolase, partial [Rhodospirillaceae bacterium]|nr:alpha/beta hydrolase [Rhodospirillaceae bacterium]